MSGAPRPGRYYDELRSAERQTWRETIADHGSSVAMTDDDYTRVFRTLYVAELIASGATLDAQAQALARWSEDSINLLANHDPQVSPTLAGRRRRPQTQDEPVA